MTTTNRLISPACLGDACSKDKLGELDIACVDTCRLAAVCAQHAWSSVRRAYYGARDHQPYLQVHATPNLPAIVCCDGANQRGRRAGPHHSGVAGKDSLGHCRHLFVVRVGVCLGVYVQGTAAGQTGKLNEESSEHAHAVLLESHVSAGAVLSTGPHNWQATAISSRIPLRHSNNNHTCCSCCRRLCWLE